MTRPRPGMPLVDFRFAARRAVHGGYFPICSVAPRVAETALAAPARLELLDDLETRLYHRHEHHLRDALAHGDGEWLLAAVPAGHEDLSLIIGVDEPHQIAQHNTMLMAEPRARQQDRRERGVRDVQRDAGRNQLGLAGRGLQ